MLILIAATAYALTIYFEHQKPKITIQPDAPIQTFQGAKTLPDFNFSTSDGKTYSIKNFAGKIIIINFWASWCPPCIKEFPNLLKAAQTYKENIVLIGISSDLDMKSMYDFLKKIGLEHNKTSNIFMTLDTNQDITKTLFQTYRLPETIIVDHALTMRKKLIGADWQYEDLAKEIENLIASKHLTHL